MTTDFISRHEKSRRLAGVVMVSDNESWVYQGRANIHGRAGSTGMMTEWQKFVQNQVKLPGSMTSGPKLICIELQPNTTTQAPERSDILNVGGFSDAVFDVLAAFLECDASRFVSEIEAVTLSGGRLRCEVKLRTTVRCQCAGPSFCLSRESGVGSYATRVALRQRHLGPAHRLTRFLPFEFRASDFEFPPPLSPLPTRLVPDRQSLL